MERPERTYESERERERERKTTRRRRKKETSYYYDTCTQLAVDSFRTSTEEKTTTTIIDGNQCFAHQPARQHTADRCKTAQDRCSSTANGDQQQQHCSPSAGTG